MENCRSEREDATENGPVIFPSREVMKMEMIKIMIQILLQEKEPSAEGAASSSSVEDSEALKILREELHRLIDQIIQERIMGPYVENWFRRIVREGFQSLLERLPVGTNPSHEAEEMILELKFMGEVSSPVLTGQEIKSKEGKPIGLALIDKKTGRIVDRGPKSSLKAEILIREVNIKPALEGECSRKPKPHFSKPQYVDLKEGVGYLCNAKLGHESKWTKNCECKLVARSEVGVRMQEALSETFLVKDGRAKWRDKSNPPSLCDPLQKLKNIGSKGGPIDRLHDKNINTVKDFRFWLSFDPRGLQEIFTGRKGKMMKEAARATWNSTVEHAMACVVDDTKTYVHFPSSLESETGVAFDAVGGIEGLIISRSHFVPVHDLSQDEKDHGRILLASAFENQKDVISFEDKTCLLKQFPQRSKARGYLSSSSDETAVHSPDNSEERRVYQNWMTDLGNMCQNQSPVSENPKQETDPCQFSSQPSSVRCSSFSAIVLAMLWRIKLMELRSVRVHKRQRIY